MESSHPDACAKESPFSSVNPPVFLGAAFLTLAIVMLGVIFPGKMESLFGVVHAWILETFGWFYMFSVAVFLVFVIGLALSSYGLVKLGPDDSTPDFTYKAWFAMLFSAGMGIGLMYFGVAEPVMHWVSPPVGEGGSLASAREALKITFFHWGFHAWAIYAVLGLSLAYFAYRHDLPLTVRSALYPLIKDRIHGPIGHAVDLFAVLGTMFGVATSLGFGVTQINAGLSYLFGIEQGVGVQIVLIVIITAIATVSVVAGLDAGIRRISELNLGLAVLLVAFVLVVGPTLFLFQALVQNVGAYLSTIVSQTFNLYAYEPSGWIGGWTLFYWAWWISWSPFVGMFIARVSRGRTIREFVIGVLMVPVGFTFIWMTVFGNTAIWLDLGSAAGNISAAVRADTSTGLFRFFEYLPLSGIASLLATLLVVTFFVTSSDSGSMVIDIITSGGNDDPPVWQRIFWTSTEGAVAAALLLAGGLGALQTASITAALPFTFIMLFVCYGLFKALRLEGYRRMSQDAAYNVQIQGASVSWRERLKTVNALPRRQRALNFIQEVAGPAMEEVAEEFQKTGFETRMEADEGQISLRVLLEGEQDFLYGVRVKKYITPNFIQEGRKTYYRADVHLNEGGQHYDVMGYTRDQLVADFLSQYEKHLHYLSLSR
ncbi:choline BCCT transporter BetT [Desulfobotulus sp.]|jgi:choline/glycine/proline betaine transport protein|uniref:BCCT family transporter n=1 Tax=Desulfobotulus sp. TaxID=1940337 RepID=UPI002A367196|nr:choline BCCT transporter BetT [Desulfobotulus sp.]MDY0162365.1 choline BCCT transporter BetT [Desulfobotulus sp.]